MTATPSSPLITSIRVESLGTHAHLTVWTRGGNAGTLVVDAADGIPLALRLVPEGCEQLDAAGGYRRWALAQATVQRDGYTLTATQDDDEAGSVAISLNGEPLGIAVWCRDGDEFTEFPIRASLSDDENLAATYALADAYAAALARLAGA